MRWGYMARNPAKLAGRNPQPTPRPVRIYSIEEIFAIAAELSPAYAPLPGFAAATGLRPEEWGALERRDVDRRDGVVTVRRTISSGEVGAGKTQRSLRQVPLTARAAGALEAIPPRLDSPYGSLPVGADRLTWPTSAAVSGVRRSRPPRSAKIYDLRSTFGSNSLAARMSIFELARVMGTSVAMIERHYGALLEGAGADIARRLSAFEAAQEQAADERLGH